MRPFLNKNILTFGDLYEHWDHLGDDDNRPGFLQKWMESPFYRGEFDNISESPEAGQAFRDLQGAYNRLRARFFSMPFGMLDEVQIHLAVMRNINDFLPHTVTLEREYNSILEQSISDLATQRKVSRTSTADSKNTTTESGLENQAQNPNTAAPLTGPILDKVQAQRNRQGSQDSSNNSKNTQEETVTGNLDTAFRVRIAAAQEIQTIWDQFLDRFKKLFVVMYAGVFDYLYKNKIEPANNVSLNGNVIYVDEDDDDWEIPEY